MKKNPGQPFNGQALIVVRTSVPVVRGQNSKKMILNEIPWIKLGTDQYEYTHNTLTFKRRGK
jgi:hypothetical protein